MPDDDNVNNNIPKILSDDSATEKEVLENVEVFYKALTTGDQNAIENVYSKTPSNEVSEVRPTLFSIFFANKMFCQILY
jgi:hypothetical protein